MSRWDFLKWNMERWWVCLLKVGGNFWSGPPTNQNRDSRPCRMIILRRCEPTNVRWDHLGLGKCSRRLRFVGVSWCHQSVSRFFKSCSFEHPNLNEATVQNLGQHKLLINLWPWYQFLQLTGWSWKFRVDFSYPSTSGLVHLGPCSCGIGVVDLCPLCRICHQLPQRGNHKRFWGNKVRYSNCMSLLGCSCTVSDVMILFHSFMFHPYLVIFLKVGLYVFDGLKRGWNHEYAFGKMPWDLVKTLNLDFLPRGR